MTQRLNPRVCRAVALSAPSERERSQWYFQRYVPHLPAGGEIVLFDRSWYNRAGVERVMGFCTDEEYEDFFQSVPEFERLLVRSGIVLVKYWFSITDDEQNLRFLMRINDPLKQWKLSPMDLESRRRWELYTKAKETMLERTHIPEAPWWVVEAVDKKRARLNCIAHLLTRVPYEESTAREAGPAGARAQSRVPSHADPARDHRAGSLCEARGGVREAGGPQRLRTDPPKRLSLQAQLALNLDLAPDLDHLIVGQVKIVAHARGVAAHRGEQSLLPARQALSVLGRNDGLGPDVVGHVVEVEANPFHLAARPGCRECPDAP